MTMRRVLALAATSLVCACGGGGSGSGDNPPVTQPPERLSGVFVDARVAGLQVRAAGQQQLTNALGQFDYDAGESVQFSIGDIQLGSAPSAAVITPVELVPGATGEDLFADPPAVLNIIRLMLTLDADADPDTGFTLTRQTRTAGLGRSLDFAQSLDAFGADPAVAEFIAAATGGLAARKTSRSLVSAEAAAAHFQQTQDELADPEPNTPPLVTAQAPAEVSEGSSATLSASATDSDGSVTGLAWTQVAGPAVSLTAAQSANATFSAPQVNTDTRLEFQVVATDDQGARSADVVSVIVRDVPGNPPVNAVPTADAGADQTVDPAADVTLDGRASTDSDGALVSYVWQVLNSSAITLVDADTPQARFVAPDTPAEQVLVFELTVTDNDGASARDQVRVTVRAGNAPPVAAAGDDQTVNEQTEVTLDASASSDADGDALQFAWQQLAGTEVTLAAADTAQARFVAPVTTEVLSLRFEVTVTDAEGAAASDQVTVNVQPVNAAPTAAAGEDQAVDALDRVTLDGQASADSDGTIQQYAWSVIDADLTIDDADQPVAQFTAPDVDVPSTLTLRLVVTDNEGASASDELSVTITPNEPPVADAGADQQTDEGQTVVLSAAASTDADDEITDYAWTQLSGPTAELTEADSAVANFVAPEVEADSELVFQVTVTDARGKSDTDTVTVGVYDIPVGKLRIGAAKASVVPSQAHIDGIEEPRFAGATHLQKFNLGGFGIDPTGNFPDPFGALGENLTEPASERFHEGPHGPEQTWIRALFVEQRNADDSRTQVLFLVLDAIGAGNVIQNELRAAVVAATGIAADNILFGQTHSHAGADLQGLWGGVPQDWIRNTLYPAAAQVALEAMAGLEPAQLEVSHGDMAQWNNYRRPRRLDPEEDADTLATLMKARGLRSGEVLGTLLQFNAHPTSINEDPRVPHPDYILGAVDHLEQQYPGSVSLYFNGPIADASASGPTSGETPYDRVRSRGAGMATDADGFTLDRIIDGGLTVRHETVLLPVTNPLFIGAGLLGAFNRYYDFLELPVADIPGIGPEIAPVLTTLPQVTPTAQTLVSRVSLGETGSGLELVTLPGEATGTFGAFVRSLAAPGDHVMLLGLTQNSFGYILPEEEFSYINASGDDGFTLPFTGYEEFVSLGPLTAPLLRAQGYLPLFDAENSEQVPPYLQACEADPAAEDCIFNIIGQRMDYVQRGLAGACLDNGGPEEFCRLLNPDTPLAEPCRDAGLPEGVCAVFEGAGSDEPDDSMLIGDALQAAVAGCDVLDPAHCLLPFPSNHFTVTAPEGSPQAAGTGRRVNFDVLAMPRNTAGKPIEPTEWNRNDGFSPGQMLVTFVPNLAANADGSIPGAPPLSHIPASLDVAGSSVVVLNAETGEPHPVWAEINLNAGLLLPGQGTPNPAGAQAAMLIRPATNFDEGQRYVVVLKSLVDQAGAPITAQPAFATCRDARATQLPPVAERCDALARDVFPVLESAGIATAGNDALYLAWDFTVASTENNIARLRHMRDDAFRNHLGQVEDASGAITDLGAAPGFTIDRVTEQPYGDSSSRRIVRRIEGTLTVPSYVTPTDPAPVDNLSLQLEALCNSFPQADIADGCAEVLGIADGGSLPPNRLFYNPADGLNPADPVGSRFGDGLPDSTGTMTTRFTCQIPADASPDNPARPGVYGHGLLDGHQAVNYDRVPEFSSDHNFLFCGVDLFGFSTGDLVNVLGSLLDLSNFQVVPDASQQGLLNFLFLARALRHPDGFGAHPAFQQAGQPVFSNREVFYDGNSQGGISGGPVVALSKDITRGVLGVVGMNYSTLLRRSVDFDKAYNFDGLPPYALPLYLSYTNDLDRDLGFALIQMLWDRSENNGYAHHITDNQALGGPDNQVLLHPAFADHQVTHWSAQVMARTIGAQVGDLYHRRPGEDVPFVYASREAFFDARDPDTAPFWDIPLVGRDAEARYDEPGCAVAPCRTDKSGFIEFDEGKTASPPIGNVPPRADDEDPHQYPRRTAFGMCQKSHFLHEQGRLIDTNTQRIVASRAECPAVPPVLPGDAGTGGGGTGGFTEADCVDAASQISEEGAEAFCAAVFALSPPDVEGFAAAIQQCGFDESGPNCVFNAGFDHLGGDTLALLLATVAEQCEASGDDLCAAFNDTVPDVLPALSRPLVRGGLVSEALPPVVPSHKTVDGNPSDWAGASSYLGGTQHWSAGEHVYTDYLFDARGADNGDDARRLALLGPVIEINDRARRIDQLEQAVGDQLGVPKPVGASDSYGETGLADGTDLHELRLASNGSELFVLARLVNLVDAATADLLLLFDTQDDAPRGAGIGHGLQTDQFDVAVRLRQGSVTAWSIASGEAVELGGVVQASAEHNAVEAVLPLEALAVDGLLRMTALTLDAEGRPSNVAYRFGEPIAGVYNEQHQALALHAGRVDAFVNLIDVASMTGGLSERVRPGVGYHERQFLSGANISTEGGENGRLQHYGLYIPSGYDGSTPTPITYWLHYRGGKGHSGAAWTPRLIRQLGEDVGNIVVTPRGRGTSSWYTTDAHQDVFEVMMDVEGLDVSDRAPTVDAATGLAQALALNVDSRRRYLSGYSMGGYGTYLFGLLYPDLFAAGYSSSGATTQGAWTGIGPDVDLCTQTFEAGGESGSACFIEANDGDANAQLNFRLLENARHFPLSIHHGTTDELVPFPGVERLADRLTELGYRSDFLRFIGYEHFSQAAIDEWVDGARYLQRFAIDPNPRQVTYKLVPALVDALNTVRPDPRDATFAFAPDGAYWVDGLVVRGVDPANPRDTSVTGQIDVTSQALPGASIVPVPQTGLWPDAPAASSPILAAGHSTPFVRSGLEWVEVGDEPLANAFEATLTGLTAASLDVTRMALDLSQPVDGQVMTDGDVTLRLTALGVEVDLWVNGQRQARRVAGEIDIALPAGLHAVQLLPPGQTPATAPPPPSNVSEAAEAAVTELQAQCDAQSPSSEFCEVFDLLTGTLLLGAEQALGMLAQQCEALLAGAPECALIADVPLGGDGVAKAGAAIVDASWHMGPSAGQFAATGAGVDGGRGYDPYMHATRKVSSDTLADRITTRALVVEGGNGKRVAVATNDLYLPNDLLRRRLVQLLAEHDALAVLEGRTPTGITEANLAMTVSHSHASPFYSTPAFGTWIFQDVFDIRFYDYMAQQMRDAIVEAAESMRPVTMGGAAVYANDVRGHTYGPKISQEQRSPNTPAGQPYDYTTRQLYVLRFDDAVTGDNLINWVVLGVHPEWVWGEEVISGDLTHATMRLLDRETGAINLMSQSETGTAGPHKDERAHDGAERHEYQEAAFAGAHRAALQAADTVLEALERIATDTPWDPHQFAARSHDFVVDYAYQRFAPPVTRPIPGVSNCNADRLYYDANPGVPVIGFPDCEHVADDVEGTVVEPFEDALTEFFGEEPPVSYDDVHAALTSVTGGLADQLAELGVPLPVSYSATTLGLVEEQATVPIQAFKLGDVAVTFCPCEQFTDPALNVISRLNRVAGDIHTGWDWDVGYAGDNPLRDPGANGDFAHGADEVGCTVDADTAVCPHPSRGNGSLLSTTRAAFDVMKAQIHNNAAGWDDELIRADANGGLWTPLHAEAEPTDPAQILGNFTHEEHPDQGYGLVIPVGMANDYWGYMPAYREYRAHDHYRKALAGLGPHGADFLATRMSRLAASLNGGAGMMPSPRDLAYLAESGRAELLAQSLGEIGRGVRLVYDLTQPTDGGTPSIVTQPQDIERFDAATVQWIGGATWLGMPTVTVERLEGEQWIVVGDQQGEVPLHVDFLGGTYIEGDGDFQGVVIPDPADYGAWRAGQFEWVWTAGYEAFASEVAVTDANDSSRPLGPYATPAGTYRFVIAGQRQDLGGPVDYALTSDPFEVRPWGGITAEQAAVNAGIVRFGLGPVTVHEAFQRGANTREPTNQFGPRAVGPIDYPDTWSVVAAGDASLMPWLRNERNMHRYAGGVEEQYCHRCSFRPWRDTGVGEQVEVTTVEAGGQIRTVPAQSPDGLNWEATVGDGPAYIAPGGIRDAYGNTNRSCINLVGDACPTS